MRGRVDLWVVAILVVISAMLGFVLPRLKNQARVPLYEFDLPASEVEVISRRLNEMNVSFSLQGGRLMVTQDERSRTVGRLLALGLPHRFQGNEGNRTTAGDAGSRRAEAVHELEERLGQEIRQMEAVADARVTLVPTDDDALPSERKPAKAAVFVVLKSAPKPARQEVEAIQTPVAFSVSGLDPANVTVVDNKGHKLSLERK